MAHDQYRDFAMGGVEMTNHIPHRMSTCLTLRSEGLLSKQIADQLGISERTVEAHFRRGLEITGCKTQHHLVAQFVRGELSVKRAATPVPMRHGSKRTQLHAWLTLMGDWLYLADIPHEQFGMSKQTCSTALIDFCQQGRVETRTTVLKQYRAIPSNATKRGPKPPKGLK